MSTALRLYLGAGRVAGPLVRLLLARRAARGREDASRLPERLGRASLPRPEGRLVWVHGASVGEAVSALPLVEALAGAGARVLLTTGTVTGAHRVGPLLPDGAVHQYAPVDTAAAVAGFLDHWRPDIAVRIESEIWPRTLHDLATRGVPIAMLNARVSARSAARWGRATAMVRALMAPVALAVAQDGDSAARLVALGVDPARVETGGSLKTAVVPPAPADADLAAARAAIGRRPVWLAASTHEGEEGVLADAHAALGPDALLVLAPRHPERGDAVAALLAARGIAFARRSRGVVPGPDARVWLADTLGEMGLWYRVAPVTFVGGSLVPVGGHTPFEPAALGSALLHGPHVANFAEAYAALDACGGAIGAGEVETIASAVRRLLAEPKARARMVEAAAAYRAATAPDVPALAARVLALAR